MKPRSLCMIVALACLAALPAATAAAASADEEAVRAANDAFYDALNAMFTGEVEAMVEVWSHADDVTYMGPMGGLEVGWPAVHEIWKEQAARRLGGSVRPERVHLLVGAELAVVVDVETGKNVDPDGTLLVVSIRATNVFRKEDGAWKMVGHHTDLLPYLAE